MDANNSSFYSKEELDLNELENHQLFYDDEVSVNSRSLFTMSKTDCQLLRQKVRQRLSVMKTNTLYVSRELAF